MAPLPGRPAPETGASGEDCLYLNVTAPASSGPWPVVVWIHGGGFAVGSGADVIGDGVGFVQGCGVVLVTVNFRLGAFGFLYPPGAGVDGDANVGLLDQIAALRWVRENIAAFGGDADRITVMGVSAGAKSIGTLLGMPAAAGLFRRAISMSGGADTVYEVDDAVTLAERLLAGLERLGWAGGGLRSVPAADLLEAQGSLATGVGATWLWRPVVDGTVLPTPPLAAIAAGSAAGVDLLMGGSRYEARFFAALDPGCLEDTVAVIRSAYGDAAEAILTAYGVHRGEGRREALIDLMSDERYRIPTIRLAEAQHTHGDAWLYRFDWISPQLGDLAAGHAAEVSIVFALEESAEAVLMVEFVRALWRAFIHDGDPARAVPDWRPYSPPRRQTLLLDLPPRVVDDPEGERRLVWEGMAAGYPNWPTATLAR